MTKNEQNKLIDKLRELKQPSNYTICSRIDDLIALVQHLDTHPQRNDDECEIISDAVCNKCGNEEDIYYASWNFCPNCGSRIKRTNGTKDGEV